MRSVDIGIIAGFHSMKRNGICFGCGHLAKKGDDVYRIEMLAGKNDYINLCGECQSVIYRDIESHHE